METKLQFIREACIKANPSIKDLVFGCKVACWSIEYTFISLITGNSDYANVVSAILRQTDKRPIKELVIIGREIRLADVLLAIMTMKYDRKNRGKMTPSYLTILPDLVTQWNLLKDSLSDQSPQTIDFIFNLLQ